VAGGPYAITASGAVDSNYTISYAPGSLTVTPAALTITANNQTSTYGSALPTLTASYSGLVNGDTSASLTALPTLTTTATAASSVAGSPYAITASGAVDSNYTISYAAGMLTVNPATLAYVADPASRVSGFPSPILTGTVTGFVLGETLADATTGALVFTSPAGPSSPPGTYAINGSGLSAVNYVFVQAPRNATALTINPTPNDPGSHANPPPSSPPNPGVGITFQNPTSGPISISFTPPVHVASNPPVGNGNDVTPAALPDGRALATNNGFVYLPISQFDANQYSQFKLPDYAAQAGEATVFAMIARGADARHAADDLIDTFWNGTSGAWTSANAALITKVTFSDGAGNTVAPTGRPGFPIVAGKTDLAQMLKTGPVMIGDGGNPVHWLLATQMTADGKGIVANDPATGKQVVLGYDPASKAVGGITGVFDSDKKTFVSLANALANPSADAHLSTLQSFVPAEFIAVTVK
jgi:hypothetical protein